MSSKQVKEASEWRPISLTRNKWNVVKGTGGYLEFHYKRVGARGPAYYKTLERAQENADRLNYPHATPLGRVLRRNCDRASTPPAASELLAALVAAVERMEQVAEMLPVQNRHEGVSQATHVAHLAGHLAGHAKIAREAIAKATPATTDTIHSSEQDDKQRALYLAAPDMLGCLQRAVECATGKEEWYAESVRTITKATTPDGARVEHKTPTRADAEWIE